jgi:hypothetical protein
MTGSADSSLVLQFASSVRILGTPSSFEGEGWVARRLSESAIPVAPFTLSTPHQGVPGPDTEN